MSDPDVFRKTKLSRSASARSNRRAILVIVSTAVGGLLAFSLINDARAALIATALIGLSALTTRIFDNI
jgi:hypothetical protein